VLEIDPNNTDAWYYKGCLLFSTAKYSEAERHYYRVYDLARADKLDRYIVSALAALRQLYSNYISI